MIIWWTLALFAQHCDISTSILPMSLRRVSRGGRRQGRYKISQSRVSLWIFTPNKNKVVELHGLCGKEMPSKPPGFWLDKFKQESRHTRELRHSAVKQVCLGSVKHATSTADFVAKSRTTVCNKCVCASCNNLTCCKTGLNVTSKTCNIAIQLACEQQTHFRWSDDRKYVCCSQATIQLVCQQCCKTSCKFLLPPLPYTFRQC